MMAAVGLAGCLTCTSLSSAALGFAFVGIGLANVIPVIFSAAGKATSIPATGVSMTATAGYAGFLVGPPLIGFTAGFIGLRLALFVPVIALLIIMFAGRGVVTRTSQST
jgi:MFS family permease